MMTGPSTPDSTRRIVRRARSRAGISLIEVLVAMAILLAGLTTLVASFPLMLQGSRDAELLTIGAALAQQKAEEIRRDDSTNRRLVTTIQNRATPTDPIVFPQEPRLAYSFSGQTILYATVTDPSDPRTFSGVARVLIRYAPSYRPTQDVLYELRFN
jgi:type II secretory pathway pseudopilin PulG